MPLLCVPIDRLSRCTTEACAKTMSSMPKAFLIRCLGRTAAPRGGEGGVFFFAPWPLSFRCRRGTALRTARAARARSCEGIVAV